MDSRPEYGFALGIPDESASASGLEAAFSGFSMKDFIENYEPRDPLDEALQPVFEVLARDFPGHRLVITGEKATLERFTEVSSYLNIAAARAVWEGIGDDAFGCFMEKVADATNQFLCRNTNNGCG